MRAPTPLIDAAHHVARRRPLLTAWRRTLARARPRTAGDPSRAAGTERRPCVNEGRGTIAELPPAPDAV